MSSTNRRYPPPPIAWVGGKRSILPEILSRFPLEFERYVEVFGGSGAVLFGKTRTPFEVWNDFNGDLYNFYYCVKYSHLQLLDALRFLPLDSRMEFPLLKGFLAGEPLPSIDLEAEKALAARYFSPPESAELQAILETNCELGDINRAAAFWKLNHLSYGAAMTSYSGQPGNLRRFYDQIHTAHNRLESVKLENKDCIALIKQYDRPGTFLYLDPPYYMAEDCYAVAFPLRDHFRLFVALKRSKGKWLLSYNNCPFVRWLYKNYRQYSFIWMDLTAGAGRSRRCA